MYRRSEDWDREDFEREKKRVESDKKNKAKILNKKWKGDEFKQGDKAIDYDCPDDVIVEVRGWSKEYGGWWVVKLPNGGFNYTRKLRPI